MKKSDRELGMDREIIRRDFLNGTSVAIGASALSPSVTSPDGAVAGSEHVASARVRSNYQTTAENYPPKRTGMRGSHEGSYEVAHAMRDGKRWEEVHDTGETYDLVVVGGGLSGLAAAYFFRKALPEARVLILDNHDDFGGHAKRNEFEHQGRQVIAYGGTYGMTGAYTHEGHALLRDIGLDAERFPPTTNTTDPLYDDMNLRSAMFFDRETFGADRLVVGVPNRSNGGSWTEFLAKTPLSENAQRDIRRIYEDQRDHLPGLSKEQKIARLKGMSYQDYLLDVVGAHPDVIPYFRRRDGDANGAGSMDNYSAWGALRSGFPALDGLGIERPHRNWLGGGSDPTQGIHFPDGNAGLARLLVRWLIPEALPGTTMEDSVATPVDYSKLDRPENPVRIRLSSTVIRAAHRGERRSADEVEVTFVRDDQAYRVRAGTCVMACYNSVIPYLCPDLSAEQKEALHTAVRKAYVYTTVLIRNWTAFRDLGVRSISCPGAYFSSISLGIGSAIGDYRSARSPEQAMAIGLDKTGVVPGLPARESFRAGREEMLATPFETIERHVRDLLGRTLGKAGFDPARDIVAIINNRWPHGYAGASNDLYDPEWGYDEAPWVVGRKRFGRIAIANSDAAATCLTQAAWDQAHRAVQELLTDVIRPEFQYPWAERT
ncbi:MAG TPA: NAD(P)-binding protein [Acidobacteriota bacterium]|nr:NAD(P)-binding protein [Acidobacteriota bacterium]